MSDWTADELTRIGSAEELQVASTRADGSLRPYVTIWVVRVGDEIYIRSAYGRDNPWFVRAKKSGTGRIRAGGVEKNVTFAAPSPEGNAAIDAAYHAKYDSHGPAIVGTVTGPDSAETTLLLVPRPD